MRSLSPEEGRHAIRDANLPGFATQAFWLREVLDVCSRPVQPEGVGFYVLDPSESEDRRLLVQHASGLREAGQALSAWERLALMRLEDLEHGRACCRFPQSRASRYRSIRNCLFGPVSP